MRMIKKIIQVAPINKLQVTTNNQQNEIHLKKELKKISTKLS